MLTCGLQNVIIDLHHKRDEEILKECTISCACTTHLFQISSCFRNHLARGSEADANVIKISFRQFSLLEKMMKIIRILRIHYTNAFNMTAGVPLVRLAVLLLFG